ncbi:MAG: DUF4870 domain-containing protein [Planctomycetota bacterium]
MNDHEQNQPESSDPQQSGSESPGSPSEETKDSLAFLDALPGPEIESKDDERQMGTIAHLLGLAGFPIPLFGMVLGPLVLWLIKKEQSAFVNDQGREAINFQITWLIVLFVLTILTTLLGFVTCGIGFLLSPVPVVAWIILMVRAAVMSGKGITYRYKYTIRFIK